MVTIKKLEEFQKLRSFVSVDTETTGYLPGDKIIQLSAIKVIDDEIVDEFDTLVNPSGVLNAAEFVNHISGDELVNQQTIAECFPSFKEFVGNLPWLGHNIPFDIRFLRAEGCDVDPTYYDTLTLARHTLGPKDNGLAKLEQRFKIENPRQHNSLDDARSTIELFKILRDMPLIRKHHEVAEAEDNLLGGMKIVITGHFDQASRSELKTLVERHGGKSPGSVSKSTDYLLLGVHTAKNLTDMEHKHSSKELKAMEYGTPVITYDDLMGMLEN